MAGRFDSRGVPYDDEDPYWYCPGGRICCIQCGTELRRDNIMHVNVQVGKLLDPWETEPSFARQAEVAGVDELACINCLLKEGEPTND